MTSSKEGRSLADGKFVTSGKRAYSEYIFDVEKDENGNLSKRKPARRGPLNESIIQGIDILKQGGGACWRCKILKKPCDAGSPCKQCSNKNSTLWQIGCRRGSLHEQLQHKYLDLPGYGSDEWYLPTADGDYLQICMTLTDPDLMIGDLELSFFRAKNKLDLRDCCLLQNFLQQFHKVNLRIGEYYDENSIESVIDKCAQIQWDIVSENSLSFSKLPKSALLIAMSLRALSYTHAYINVVSSIRLHGFSKGFHVPEFIYNYLFSIKIWKHNPDPQTLSDQSIQSSGHFSSMIQNIVRVTHQALLRRCPTEWPSLLCVLALLKVMQNNLELSTGSIRPPIKTAASISEVCMVLGQLYHMCTKGKHPLAENCKWEDYASLVGHDQLAVAQFRSLNEMWVERRDIGKCLEDPKFSVKLECFVDPIRFWLDPGNIIWDIKRGINHSRP